MKIKYTLLLIAFVAVSNSTFAQFARDAIRFSGFQNGSTSRLKGVGNAGTAVGGDLSSISNNPAGLGYFTQSEVALTGEFDNHTSNTTYLGKQQTATKGTPNLSQFGAVFYTRLNTPRGENKTEGFVSLNYGIAFSRTNNFDERVNSNGFNTPNSINNYYANLANSEGVDNGTLQDWAFQQQLISRYGTPTNNSFAPNSYPGVDQTGYIDRSGGQNAADLSVGTNYNNKLYLGLNVSIANLRYKSTKTFTETGTATLPASGGAIDRSFNSQYAQIQDTKGEGFSAKLGVIYKVIEYVRLGATITSPTFLTLDDSFSETLNTSYNGGAGYEDGVEYPTTYNIRTPYKASGGMSVFVGQFGFITADAEYVDYASTHISSNEYYTNTFDLGVIKNNYRSVVNLRGGAEAKIAKIVSLRAGYSLQPSPLKSGGFDTKTLTGGLGVRVGSLYADAAYMRVTGSRNELYYDIGATSPAANINQKKNNFFLTVGFRY
ncbi:MAG: hypothetical protein V4619_12315 [Bacteroidota bacterium]